MICLVQLLYWEAAVYAGNKDRFLTCDRCPFREKCDKRRPSNE